MNKYDLIEAPISIGSPTRGSENAYSALVSSLRNMLDCNEIPFANARQRETHDGSFVKDADEVMRINKQLYQTLCNCKNKTFLLGGDHSVVMASVSADAQKYGAENVAVVYVDGHADINTEKTSITGYIHGMPLAVAMGLTELTVNGKRNLYGKNLFIVGARSIDDGEYNVIKDNGVTLYTAKDVKQRGVQAIIDEILPKLEGKKVHLSFDVDAIDGEEFSATGYVMPDGLTIEQVKQILSAVINNGVVSFDCVEYNPTADNGEDKQKLLDILSLLK